MVEKRSADTGLVFDTWPALPLDGWRDTYATLHRWTQIVGKVRLARMPWVNHSWHVTLYITARGLTTGPIPAGTTSFQIDFDFIDHQLAVRTSNGDARLLALRPRSVADFYQEFMVALRDLGVETAIYRRPNELEDATPFGQDESHTAYDPDAASRCWRLLARTEQVFTAFRARFLGKCSPVHFFWGAFDLAVTRFSGRRAPPHPGGIPNLPDWVVREAYSRECSSCGFWPGSGAVQEPAFYAYAYPEPDGFKGFPIRPRQAFYSTEMKEFILRYEDVRTSDQPEQMLLDFCQSTYEAAAERGKWDRENLEKDYPAPEKADADKDAAFPKHHG